MSLYFLLFRCVAISFVSALCSAAANVSIYVHRLMNTPSSVSKHSLAELGHAVRAACPEKHPLVRRDSTDSPRMNSVPPARREQRHANAQQGRRGGGWSISPSRNRGFDERGHYDFLPERDVIEMDGMPFQRTIVIL